MKAITHDFFSLGLCLYLEFHIGGPPSPLYLLLIVWLAVATNQAIDGLGHLGSGGGRSFWTHSVFTAPLWGIVVAMTSVYLLDLIIGQYFTAAQVLFAAGLGIVLAYSHLMLDALTEGGVYAGRQRIALAHLRYDNLILNGAFVALGLLLVLASFV